MYNYKVQVRDEILKFRKWKVKDRNKYVSNQGNTELMREALVYDCLENDNVALSDEEYKYVLCKIRDVSISDPIEYTFTCGSCGHEFDYNAKLSEIITCNKTKYGLIEAGNDSFVMGAIRNRKFYTDMTSGADENAQDFIDFILHIHSYNLNDAMTFDELTDAVNNLDIDVFENVYTQWEQMKFKVNNTHTVTCPECNEQETYEFDDLPGFFPSSWNK